MQRDIRNSACPHDCPSTCALEIEVLDGKRIGAVRGAEANSYTAGVICAKVARYAERIHHPDRLTRPLLRTGPKGSGQFRADLLGRGAGSRGGGIHRDGRRGMAPRRCGRITTPARWGWCSATASTGCATSCAIRARPRRSARRSARPAGWPASAASSGPDPREMARSDLIVMWGGNPVVDPGQRDDAYRARTEGARRQAGGGRSVSHRHRGGGGYAPGVAARHRCARWPAR